MNSSVELKELIFELSEPARSFLVLVIFLRKIWNPIVILKKRMPTYPMKSVAKASHTEFANSQVRSLSGQGEARQFARPRKPKDRFITFDDSKMKKNELN